MQLVIPEFPFLVNSTITLDELGVYEHAFVSVKDAEELIDYAFQVELFDQK